jgi:hypothetical protein
MPEKKAIMRTNCDILRFHWKRNGRRGRDRMVVAVSFIGGGNRRKQRPLASHRQTLSYNVALSTPRHERG